jgi:hypothetical protein
MGHGTFIFPHEPVYGWYLSVTAIGLNISWALHNVIAWMKCKAFLSRKVSIFYIVTVILCWPYWGLEIYANFTYFNNINKLFLKTRPLEPLFRFVILSSLPLWMNLLTKLICSDPWWVFTTVNLFWTIKRQYSFGLYELVRISPRMGIMLLAMCLSIIFIIVDTCSVTNAFSSLLPTGVEPFWKVSQAQVPSTIYSPNPISQSNKPPHSYRLSSSASATRSSSTISKQPSIGCAHTG